MIQTVFISFIAGIGGLWLADKFVPGIAVGDSLQDFLIPGILLGIIIAVIKPLISIVSLMLRIIVLGAIILGSLWILSMLFPAIMISGFTALIFAAALIAGIAIIASLL